MPLPILKVYFYRSSLGREPVRDWLKSLEIDNRKVIGEDIKLVQFRWPLGMPLVRKIEKEAWEVRSDLGNGMISRVFFTVSNNKMILLHGIIKKSQKTPKSDIEIVRTRKNQWFNEEARS